MISLLGIVATLLASAKCGAKENSDSLKIYAEHPQVVKGKKLLQNIYIGSDHAFTGKIDLACYRYVQNGDSILVLSKKDYSAKIKKGAGKVSVNYIKDDTLTSYAVPYFEILKRAGGIAPGRYRTIVTVLDAVKGSSFTYMSTDDIDSNLHAASPARDGVNSSLAPTQKKFLGLPIKKDFGKVKAYQSGKALVNRGKKIHDKAKENGLEQISYTKDGKSYIDFYYQGWFAGKYEVLDKKSLQKQLEQQQSLAGAEDINQLSQNDLGTQPTMFSQFKKFKKQKDDNKDIKGEIAIATNVANDPDPGSGVDNNYYEVRGMVEVPVMNLPVELEGMYTSQDNHRSIKSSYFRVHYDVSKAKDELQNFIGAYNQKFAEAKAKGVGMEQVYPQMISKLESRKAILEAELESKASQQGTGNVNPLSDIIDTAAIRQEVGKSVDTSAAGRKVAGIKAAALKDKNDAEKKYNEIEELDRKIGKYKTMMEQSRNNKYFDSAVAYSKMKDHDLNSSTSYKQLVKKSSDILPDGRAKKFVSGITNVDAGMFPKYTSKYTMSGQMMKGLDLGYDFGFCEVAATVGKTEYIGRDGTMDKYTCYSGRSSFTVAKEQKISLVYYGYTVDKTAFAGDGFFKNVTLATPTFFHPVHIFSLNYGGMLSKYVTVEAESAVSIKKIQPVEGVTTTNKTGSDNMAWHLGCEGNIPNTSIALQGTYDKTGKQFENNTLPLSRNGTEQYKVAGKSDFFRSFLSIGIEYNYLVQSSFSGTATNTKWGFDVKTHSKRYPSVSVSYKPYATFRSYTDTLNIPQRPLLGSIWTSKASYQLKRQGGKVWRFSLLYSQCKTELDTVAYGNTLMQGVCSYTEKVYSVSSTIGYTSQHGSNTAAIVTTPNSMGFVNFTESYVLGKGCSIACSQDVGHTTFGFCKYGLSAGIVCSFKKSPVTARLNIRCSDYKLNVDQQWKQLYSGNMEVAYKFKAKKKKNNV